MAGPSKQSAKLSVDLEDNVSGGANDAGDSLESLRQRVNGSNDAIKAMQAQLRALRGNTDEVKAAKDQLKARIAAAQSAISSSTLAMHKQGVTLEALNKRHAELGKAAAETAKAEEKAKAAMSEQKDLLERLREKYDDAGGAAGLFASGSMIVAGAVLALTAAVVSGVVALTHWIVVGADAARTMRLMREGALGSAQDASALGTQIDALASKVPLARDKISEIGLSLHRAGIGGQTLVDTMNAIAGATAGLDDAAGGQLKALVERGKLTQRLQINPLELQGSGLKLDDVAKKLAGNLHVGVAQAKKALVEGRVKLADGAKALSDAVDERFGATNQKKALSLNVATLRLHENLAKLTDGVNMEPLLEGVSRLVALFSESTDSGKSLKAVVTLVGNAISSVLTAGIPIAEQGFKRLIIAGLDVAIATLEAKKQFDAWFSKSNLSKVDFLGAGLTIVKVQAQQFLAVAGAIGSVIGTNVRIAVVQLDFLVGAYQRAKGAMGGLLGASASIDWSTLGRDVINGFVKGLTDGVARLKESVKNVAHAARDTFRETMKIHSPSRVAQEDAAHVGAGWAGGIDDGKAKVESAVERVSEVVSISSGSDAPVAAGGGGAPITVYVEVSVHAADGPSAQKTIESPSFVDSLSEQIRRSLATAGLGAT